MSNPTTLVLVVFALLAILRIGGTKRLKAIWDTAFAP